MKRCPLRFSVRSLLVLITLCGLALGAFTIFVHSHIQAYHLEQQMLAEWNRLELVVTAETAARGPAWLQKWKDGKYAQRVVNLSIQSRSFSETELAKLRRLEYLQWLRIESDAEITDEALSKLANVAILDTLYLANTHVRCTGTGELSRLNLRSLIVSGDRFTNDDAEWIHDLQELTHVQLRAPVTGGDVKSLASLPKLESLKIVSDQFTDDGLAHVSQLVNLRFLDLECPVSDAGMEHLIPLKNLERLVCFAGPQASNLVHGLRESVRAKYQETPLVDAISVMSKLTGIAMRIDNAALQSAGISASDVMLTVDENGDLRQAFDAMLTPHGLACVGESGGLLITTKEEAARRRPGTMRLLDANPKLEAYVPW